MPLTPSHAAAALPLSLIAPALPTSALIIGTLAPDFEYLLRLAPRGTFGHSLLGSVIFCVPLGLAVWFVYETRIRATLLQWLPAGFEPLLSSSSLRRGHATNWILATVAIWLGAASHIGWDSFTHGSGWAVMHFAFLRDPIVPALSPRLPWFKALQHGSTVFGACIVIAWGYHQIRRQPTTASSSSKGRGKPWLATGVVGIAACLGILNGLRVRDTGFANMLGYTAVGAMSALAVLLVVFSVATRWHRREATS